MVLTLTAVISLPLQAGARDLVYAPVNPTFGGNPLNGSYLLGAASANNYRYTESPESKRERRQQQALTGGTDPAAQFERQITASLLSQIASTVGQQILGENARDSGTFSVGGTNVQFNRIGGQINIDITEASTGGRTNIQIPVPQY
ncbi:curli assembly protein CsgF [Teichococcus vastitatis]|uniref:Curli production assembly/transport component CsgF n=1 Tax=Teichococcus vastitatis TaxID=2307076 RepID=A0ABS9W2V5_9PROT|nr:curli assembly protein CsgF [Pseudoroseomonas vastitatis]MCI0753506.1 curli assembly protein CsgF [Pseudoroseomonas vastitatis]